MAPSRPRPPEPGGGGPERLKLEPWRAGLLGLVVAAFITPTGYLSGLPWVHHHWGAAAAEGIVIGALAGGVAGARGMVLREPRPPRPGR